MDLLQKLLTILLIITSTKSVVSDQTSLDPKWRYLTHNQSIDFLNDLQQKYSNLVKISSIGKSVQNRDLTTIKITKDAEERQILKPMFKYVANIHGNEALGNHLLLVFAQYLCDNYGKDTRVTKIVDNTEVHLLPSMNPDGYETAKEGDCDGAGRNSGRKNANGVDLNRDFPDQFVKENPNHKQQPETLAVMTWIVSNPFVLSANLHGGSLVASYPFDDSAKHRISGFKSAAPDDPIFKHLALTYSMNHKTMRNGSVCQDDSFTDGITNGAEWYDVPGGMQDFNYVNSNCFEITLELSCCKYPKASQLEKEWNNNKESLLAYVELIQMGIKGLVRDSLSKKPIEGATVQIEGVRHNVTTTNRGEYWRLTLPGVYAVTARAVGYESLTKRDVVVMNTTGTSSQILNFDLKPVGGVSFDTLNTPEKSEESVETEKQKVANKTALEELEKEDTIVSVHNMTSEYDFRTKTEFKHHNYSEMKAILEDLSKKYKNMTRLYSIGQSYEKRDLLVLEISTKPGVHEPGKPEFKYVANMHGNEVIGRELVLLLAKYLLENYGLNNKVTKIIDTTRIHLMPTMNPDGYELSMLGDCNSEYGRGNAHKVDLNRNFPDQYFTTKENTNQEKETLAIMKWLKSYPFVLSANLHGGSLVANYPYDGNPQQRDGIYSKTPDDTLFKHLALTYSINHPTMHLGRSCPKDCGVMNENFTYGITNGAQWYALYGGMQDWNYLHTNCFEITLELGCRKYPYEYEVKGFWDQNRRSLIAFMEEVHQGVKGFVIDTDGKAVNNATIRVESIEHDVHSAVDGDYWRLLLPGTYQITAFKEGYGSQSQTVTVLSGSATNINFTLETGYIEWSKKFDFDNQMNLAADKYFNNNDLHSTLQHIAVNNKNIVKIFSNKAPNRERVLHFLIVSDFESDIKDKPNVVVVGGMHGDQPVGRELLIRLVRHLVDGHTKRDPRIVHLLRSLNIHIIPSVDDTGFLKAIPGMCNRSLSIDDDLEDKFSEEFANKFGPIEAIKKNFVIYKYLTGVSIETHGLEIEFPLMINAADLEGPSLVGHAFKLLSESYKNNNPMLSNGTTDCSKGHSKIKSKSMVHIHSNRESILDYAFNEHKALLVSARIDCCTYPLSYDLPKLWKNNLESLISFLETSVTGITGYVLDSSNRIPKGLSILMDRFDEPIDIDANTGKFSLVLKADTYTLHFAAPGYENKSLTINVKTNENKKVNVIMDSTGLALNYHNYEDMAALLTNLSNTYPQITSLYSIGESVQKRKILVFKIGSELSIRGAEVAKVRFIGGLNGNERATTEIVIQLIEFLLSHYKKDSYITQLIDTTHIYLAPLVNPDGSDIAQIGKCDSNKGLTNAKDVDLDQSFIDPDIQTPPETKAIKDWTKKENFLVSVTFRTGGNVVTYPFSGSDSSNRRPLSEMDKLSFEHLALKYANAHKDMHLGSARCGHGSRNRPIKGGFTTGSIWHLTNGTLLDYGFNESNIYEFYVYIGCCGSPVESSLSQLWRDHKTPILELLYNVNNGIHGRVVDENGLGISNAKITVQKLAHKVYTTDSKGHYRIPLFEGKYVLTVEADGYWPNTKMANIYPGQDNLFVIDMMTDTRILGIPRAVFVIITGSFVLTILIVSLCVYNVLLQRRYQNRGFRRIDANGGMSLFDDDDNDDDDDDDDDDDHHKGNGLTRRSHRIKMKVKEYTDAPSSSEDELYNVHQWKRNNI